MLAKVSKISTAVLLGTMMLAGAAGNVMAAENKTVLTLVAQQETAWVKNSTPSCKRVCSIPLVTSSMNLW